MRHALTILVLLASPAAAQPSEPETPVQPPPEKKEDQGPTPEQRANAEADARMQALEKRLEKVEEELEDAKDDNKYLEDKIAALAPLQGKLGGYLDFGFFGTTGNGAGTREDIGHAIFPQYSYVPESWVFYGDPLSTTINSRGDVADTGESRAITFDPVNSKGKTTFMVNALNLTLFTGIGETAQLNASVDLLPRSRDISDPSGLFLGDYIDVKLAYGEWRPHVSDNVDLMLQAGKFDSVLGYEYRSLESPDRLNVTPSLICRYTCGRPLGLKARAQFLNKKLIGNVAVTNGTHFSEGFAFANETDTNQSKTVAGRLSYAVARGVEVGVSGAWGAQDFQSSSDVHQWHNGIDVHAEIKDLELTAEFVRGRAKGETSTTSGVLGPRCDIAPCLKYYGGYLLAGYRVSNTWIPFFRMDFRDATHWSGDSFVYVSQVVRFTAGVRAEIGAHVIVKAEATRNLEMDLDSIFEGEDNKIPVIPDDVVTTSLVIKY